MNSEGAAHAREFWNRVTANPTGGDSQSLATIETHLVNQTLEHQYHYAPTRFNPDSEFQLAPQPLETGLPSLEETIRDISARITLTILPEFWNIESLVFWTHKRLGIVHAPLPFANIPAAVEILKQLKPPLATASIDSAHALDLALDSNAHVARPALWHIVIPLGTDRLFMPRMGTAIHDIHLMPGRSIAYQCAHLASRRVQEFHPSSEYLWEESDGHMRITSIDRAPLPLLRFDIGYARISNTPCHCGRNELLSFL